MRFDLRFGIAVAVAIAFVLVVFLTSRDTGPSAEIDEEAAARTAQQAREEAAAIVHAPPPFRLPVEWQDQRPTDTEFRATVERFCDESAAIRAEEDQRLRGVAVNRNWSQAEIQVGDLKARAAELKRLFKGLTRAGLPASQVRAYRDWRASVRRHMAILLDYSGAVRAEKADLANSISGQLADHESESRALATELKLTVCATP